MCLMMLMNAIWMVNIIKVLNLGKTFRSIFTVPKAIRNRIGNEEFNDYI